MNGPKSKKIMKTIGNITGDFDVQIEHIVWEDWNYDDKKVSGILELEVYWHGGGTDIVIMEGTYTHDGRGKFVNSFVTIDEDTMGFSGMTLRRIGQIAG